MSNKKILILPGDGIGNEVMAEVFKIIDWMEKTKSMSFDISERLVRLPFYNNLSIKSQDYIIEKIKEF